MSDTADIFDVCNDQDLIEMTRDGILVKTGGRYRMTFTALMKATSTSPMMVEITRVRDGLTKTLGLTGLRIDTLQGQPQLGLSSSLDMLEELEENDLIEIKQIESGEESFLRSSAWRLLRLDGHITTDWGIACDVQISEAGKLSCTDQAESRVENVLRIERSGLYELALSGVTFQVSIQCYFGISA